MSTDLLLADPAAGRGVGALARRVAEREPEAVLRVVARGGRLGAFAATPFDVLVLRGARLADEGVALDVVVEAATLAATAVERADGVLRLPPDVGALRWTWPLPPPSGWSEVSRPAVADLVASARAAVTAFQAAADALPDEQRTRAALERLAAAEWDREAVPGVTARMAHAAQAHGFLGDPAAPEGVGLLAVAGRWRRLELPYGTVLARDGGLVLRA